MSQFPTGVRVAQAVGLTGAAWLAGNIAAFSLISVPALLKSYREHKVPLPLIVKQWRDLYNFGKDQNPYIATVTAAAFAYLAWSVREGTTLAALAPQNAASLYSAAGALTLIIVPWTLTAMRKTNELLLNRAGAAWVPTDKSSEEVQELLEKWAVLNTVRGLFPLAGAIAGFLAL